MTNKVINSFSLARLPEDGKCNTFELFLHNKKHALENIKAG